MALPTIISQSVAELEKLEPAKQVKSWITDFEQVGEQLYARINGAKVLLSSGTAWADAARQVGGSGFPAASVMRAMSSTSSAVGKVFKSAAPFAGPIGIGLSVGASLVSKLVSLFGSSPTPPVPTVDGIDIRDFEDFLYHITDKNWPTAYDRYVEVAADLISGRNVHGRHGPDLKSSAEGAIASITDQLVNILLDNRGRSINPSRYRHLAMLISAIDGQKIKDIINNSLEPRMIPNLTALIAYGAPRIQLRKALSYYGLFLLADTSAAAAGYKNNKCDKYFYKIGASSYRSKYSGLTIHLDTRDSEFLRDRPSETKLCYQLDTYGTVIGSRSLPVIFRDQQDAHGGGLRILQQLPKAVIEEEIALMSSSGASDYRVHVEGNSTIFEFDFSGTYKRYGIRWPKLEDAIAGMLRVALAFGKTHTDNLKIIRRDIEGIADTTKSVITVGEGLDTLKRKIAKARAGETKPLPLIAIATALLLGS